MNDHDSSNADSSPRVADEGAAGVATSAATTAPATAEAVSAQPAGESAPAGDATQTNAAEGGEKQAARKERYRITRKGEAQAGRVDYANSVHTAYDAHSHGDDVFDLQLNKPYAQVLKDREEEQKARQF